MKQFRLWMSVAVLFVLATPLARAVEAPERFIELLLQSDGQYVTLVKSSVRTGRAPITTLEGESGQWVIRAQDATGTDLSTVILPDPRVRYSDALVGSGTQASLLASSVVTAPSAFFTVRVPYDAQITQFTISRLTAPFHLTAVPTSSARSTSGNGNSAAAVSSSVLAPIGTIAWSSSSSSEGGPCGGVTGSRYRSETLYQGGPSDNRVDIVFMGDGYTAAQQHQFRQEVITVRDALLGSTPLKEYQSFINIHAVYAESRESGVDHPEEGVARETALNMRYGVGGPLCIDTDTPALVFEAACSAPAPADVIMVLVNDTPRGGCARPDYSVTSMGQGDPLGPSTVIHEFGHVFARLADEQHLL